MAIKSSNLSGLRDFKCFCIPYDSNWNVPFVYPLWNNSYVLGSSSVKLSKLIFFPVVSFTFFTAVFSIDRVFNPKKSIFNIPADSITLLSNWVIKSSESLDLDTGI